MLHIILENPQKYPLSLPSRHAKWCNGHYKMDCVRQFTSWQKSLNKEAWFYIGFCADEEKRFKKNVREIYPLAIEGISEIYNIRVGEK